MYEWCKINRGEKINSEIKNKFNDNRGEKKFAVGAKYV